MLTSPCDFNFICSVSANRNYKDDKLKHIRLATRKLPFWPAIRFNT